jgi:hypothetical protein
MIYRRMMHGGKKAAADYQSKSEGGVIVVGIIIG